MTTSLGGVHVDVTLSLRGLGATLARELKQAGREAGREVEKELGDTGRKAGQAFTKNYAEVVTKDRSAQLWARRVGNAVSSSLTTVRSFGAEILKVGALLSGLSLGALGGTAAAGGIAVLASELAALSGAIAVIPAAGVAAAATLTTLTIGFQGIGEAIKADDVEKFNKAIAELSPNARAAAVAAKELGDETRALRISVQDALFAGVADTLQQLAGTYLPVAQRGFRGLATEINAGARAFADFLLQPGTIADTSTVFDGIRESIRGAIPGVISFAEAFRDIVTVGTGFLPELAARFSELGRRFADFIAQARDSGALEEFISNGINAVRELFAVLKNVGSILGSVFSAANASGISVLGTVRELTGQFADFLKSTEGQDALTSFFTSAADAARVLAPIFLELFSLLANDLAPILADVAEIVGPAVTEVVAALGTALTAAAPGIRAFAAGFAAFLVAVAPAAGSIGQLAAALGTTLGQVLTRIGPQLGDLVTVLADNLAAAFSNPALINGLVDMATAFGDIVIALAPLLPDLAQLAGTVLTALAEVLGPLAQSLLPPLVELFSDLLPVIEPLVSLFVGLLGVLTPIIDVISFLIGVVGDLIGVFVDAAEGIGDLTSAALDFLTGTRTETGLVKSEFNAFADESETSFGRVETSMATALITALDFADGTVGAVGAATAAVISGSQQMNTAVRINLEGIGAIARAAFGQITTAARKELERTKAAAAEAIAGVKSVINGADFSAAGAGLIRSLADGIASDAALAAVRAAARRAIEAVAAFLPSSPAKEGPFSGRGWSPFRGAALADGFARGMVSRLGAVESAATRLAGAAVFAPALPGPVSTTGDGGRGTFPVLAAVPGAAGSTHKTVNFEQHVHVPSTDVSAFAAVSGAHMRVAASKLMR